MRSKVFSQLDTRLCKLPYPSSPYNIGSSGCGCCSVTHVIIEADKYKNYTPKKVQPYMKQFAVRGQGTQWAGITKSMQHYGFSVINHATMSDLFKTLNKRKMRLGILLFIGGKRGGITWTTAGHYVAFTDYKIVNGKHYFYTKDSGGRKHTGWYCYEDQMIGLVRQCWSALPPKETKTKKKETTADKIIKQASETFADMTRLKFKYTVSGNATSWSTAKKKKTSNCATYVSYVLQNLGLLKAGQVFWCNDGKVKYKGNGTESQLKKNATISHPKKAPKKAKLKAGDICGYSSPAHTQIFAGYDKKGNALWYSFGPSDIGKKLPRKRGSYNSKKIDTVIRFK
nr:hypothetical protein [Clostridia bacterium]